MLSHGFLWLGLGDKIRRASESSLCFQPHGVSMTWGSVTQICCTPQSTVCTSGGAACSLALGHPEIPSGVLHAPSLALLNS